MRWEIYFLLHLTKLYTQYNSHRRQINDMTEVTPEKILERAKFLHIDMLSMQISIRQNIMRRLFRDGKQEEGERQYLVLHELTMIYIDRNDEKESRNQWET